MAIEDTKRWHWILVGLVAGLALSYAWTSMDPAPMQKSTESLGFERELNVPPLKSGEPNVTNIVVFPPVDGVYPVQFDLRTPTKDGKAWTYTRWSFVAETPYKSTVNPAPTTQPNETILTHLSRLAATNKNVKFTYAWWRTPRWTYILWTAGAVVVIGGVWPTILNLLVGAGFGRSREEKDDYDLSRFGKGAPDEKPAVKPKGLTEEDLQQIRDMEARVENALGLAPEPKPEPVKVETAIRELDAGPLEAKPVEEQSREDKEYKGEFYPTARAKKKS